MSKHLEGIKEGRFGGLSHEIFKSKEVVSGTVFFPNHAFLMTFWMPKGFVVTLASFGAEVWLDLDPGWGTHFAMRMFGTCAGWSGYADNSTSIYN